MKQYLYTISLLLLLSACTDETYTDTLSAAGGKPGKPVPVKLSLSIQPQQSPFDADTKAGGRVISSTEVCKGMEISLVKTPVTRAADKSEIKNFSVFQFAGTKPASTLIDKHFHEGYSVKKVTLTESSVKNRIIVIANADKTTFESIQNGITLENFNKLGIDSEKQNFPLFTPNEGSARTILTGSADMKVTTNSQADIMLYHSTAQVMVNLKLGKNMKDKYSNWSYQFRSIPKMSYYNSIGRTPAFPGDAVEYGDYALIVPSWSSDATPAATITTNLPVNLHHEVPYTTPEKRVTNAPTNSTFLQITGANMTGEIINKSVTYNIHLGADFTSNYSISPNYTYTYQITITDENDDDSRVIKFIPGYFGGALKMYGKDSTAVDNSNNAVTWRYEKRIEVYVKDVGNKGAWVNSGASMPTTVNSFIDGRANTEALRDNADNYPAVKKCIDLNGVVAAGSSLTWYMPSFGQSLSIYVSGASTLKTLPDATYWTSSANSTKAWGTKIWSGRSTGEYPTDSYFLRCIKDLKPGNMAQ